MKMKLKRVYDAPSRGDGIRVLVDRLWPRGLSKDAAQLDDWFRDIAPSNELRKWYGHDPAKWRTFRTKYLAELKRRPELLDELLKKHSGKMMTLLYSAKDGERSNAAVLKEFLEKNAGLRQGGA